MKTIYSREKDLGALVADLVEHGGVAHVISSGKPCRCGPGFCASDAGVGFYGFCSGSRETSAPDCADCGALHQSNAGCWLCSGKPNGNEAMWLQALREGVTAPELFELQERLLAKGEALGLDEVLSRLLHAPLDAEIQEEVRRLSTTPLVELVEALEEG